MHRIVRTAMLIGAIAIAAGATEASAQVNFAIGGGPSFATGDLGDGLDMGYHGQLSLGFGMPMLPIGLRADGMYTRFNAEGDVDGHLQWLSGSLNAVVNLPTPGITPYLIGGVGLYAGKVKVADVESDTETDLGINVGAGLRMGLPGLGIFAEARLHNVFTEGESSRFIPVTLGIRL
jgi:opacity protein-like surface antigen